MATKQSYVEAAAAFADTFGFRFAANSDISLALGFELATLYPSPSKQFQDLALYGDGLLKYWVCKFYRAHFWNESTQLAAFIDKKVANKYLYSVATYCQFEAFCDIDSESSVHRVGDIFEAILAVLDHELGWTAVEHFMRHTWIKYTLEQTTIVDGRIDHQLCRLFSLRGLHGIFSVEPATIIENEQWFAWRHHTGPRVAAVKATSYTSAIRKLAAKFS